MTPFRDGAAAVEGDDRKGISEFLPDFLVVLAFLATLLVLWLGVLDDYGQAQATARVTESTRTKALADKTKAFFESSRGVFDLLGRWMTFHPNMVPQTNPELGAMAAALRRMETFQVEVRLIDYMGRMYGLVDPLPTGLQTVEDRDYFQAQLRPPSAGFYIGNAVVSRVTQQWVVPLAAPAGPNQGGIVAFSVPFTGAAWEALAEEVPPSEGTTYLLKPDGTILFTYPFDSRRIGQKLDHNNESDVSADVGGSGLRVTTQRRGGVFFDPVIRSKLIFLAVASLVLGLNTFLLVRLLRTGSRSRTQWRYLAQVDPLTEVLNRRAFHQHSGLILARCRGGYPPCTLVMVDADEFKSVNDRFGHPIGDRVLTDLAQCLGRQLRPGDLLGRIGGEEFAVFLPETSQGQAIEIANRLRQRVAGTLKLPDGTALTISLGVAQAADGETLDSLIERADKALLTSKSRGRNCVTMA